LGKMDMDTPENGGAFRHRGAIELPPCLFLGEAVERSEDGEGKQGKVLSVTFGDSSPRGRAKGCTLFYFSSPSGRTPDSLSLSSAVR
jgi:hypothetical protein